MTGPGLDPGTLASANLLSGTVPSFLVDLDKMSFFDCTVWRVGRSRILNCTFSVKKFMVGIVITFSTPLPLTRGF